MTTLHDGKETPTPSSVRFTSKNLVVDLADGRSISTPLDWYPVLMTASLDEREAWELSAFGVHWPALDEDLSVAGMLAGRHARTLHRPPRQARFMEKIVSIADFRDQRKRFAVGNLLADVDQSSFRRLIESVGRDA